MAEEVQLEPIDFDIYSDDELLKLSQELLKKNEFLAQENLMFERYYQRCIPMSTEEEPEAKIEEQEAKKERREKKKKGIEKKEEEKPALLTTEQKIEVATRELEELKDEIQRNKDDWARLADNYKAELEEVEIRSAEIKKAVYEFKRDIETQSVNKRTNKVFAERVVRYFEDKIRSKEAIIEKMRLKNATLKVQKNKLHLQLKQKEEMGEVLHAIDFDQLQIENKQYMQKIEERNNELLKLKMTAGSTIQTLNSHKVFQINKKRLNGFMAEHEKLVQEIWQRKELLKKLDGETVLVTKERQKQSNLSEWLTEKTKEFKVPGVLDYVMVKSSHYELQKKLKNWKRKVEITEMQTKRMRIIWKKMCLVTEFKNQIELPSIVGK